MDLNQILWWRERNRKAVSLKLWLHLMTGAQLGVVSPARLSQVSSVGAGSLQGRSETVRHGGSVQGFCLPLLMLFHFHAPEENGGGEKTAEGKQCA